MREQQVTFSTKTVTYLFDSSLLELQKYFAKERWVIITDQNIYAHHRSAITGIKTIVIPAGEQHKQQATVDSIILQLLQMEAERSTVIVGLGGGVVTDIAGYVASIFKRGVRLVQVPTSILAMVDAAVGGKNGVDVGDYKNQVGTIYQPDFLIFDYQFLHSLPREEWVNGFAEIIKHACIKDADQFKLLASHGINDFIQNPVLLAALIEKNVGIKLRVVLNDEQEQGERKLLNYGHTLGHAIESHYQLPHGHAISIGMVAAASLSMQLAGLSLADKERIVQLLINYELPVTIPLNKEALWRILLNDKKRDGNAMNFILLRQIGEAIVAPIPLASLESLISQSLLQ